jgi:hypothetical protein
MRFLRGFGRFWFDFIVGDDWRIALGVVLVLGLGALLVAIDVVGTNVLMPLLAAAIVALVAASIVLGARR